MKRLVQKEKFANPEIIGIVLMVICVLVTSLAGAATKLIVADVSVYTIACMQYLICLVLLIPRLVREREAGLATSQLGWHLVRGAGGWLCFLFYYLAIAHIPLVDAALLRSASPLCVPLVLLALNRRGVSWQFWIPIVVGFVGVGLILRPESDGISGWHAVGFLSAVFLAVSMVLTRKLTISEPPVRILFYYFALSFICGLPLMMAHWQPVPLSALPYLAFIGLAIYVALTLYTKAYQYGRASVISPLSYFGVVFAGLWGWLIWDHIPDGIALVGICLVVVGGIFTVWVSE